MSDGDDGVLNGHIQDAQKDIGIDTDFDFDFDIDSTIASNKAAIKQLLTNQSSSTDSSLLQGTLSFCNSKFSSYILNTLSNEYILTFGNNLNELSNNNTSSTSNSNSNSNQSLHLNPSNSNSVDKIVGRVWIEIHHPAIKYFQSSFHQLNKSSKLKNRSLNSSISISSNNNSANNNSQKQYSSSFVEYKKLFDKFVKFISKAYDFYFTILKSILNTYDLSIYIPVKKLASTLKLDLKNSNDKLQLPRSNHLVFSLIYITHKCVLFIGDLSRYRTLVAKTYLPSTSISKEDNNNYSKSIELYKLSLLILPSLGDPYNHIAIIDNLKDDKFNVVYNFIRASLTSSPLTVSYTNLLNLLSKHPRTNSILRKFEYLNSLERSTITKNDRLCLLKSQFLILLNYNLLPDKWRLKNGYLISGHPIGIIENDFYYLLSTLDFHKQIFNDFYFKQLVILIGGFELLIDNKIVNKNIDIDFSLSQSSENIQSYLDFLFRYLETFLKICVHVSNENLKSLEKRRNKLNDELSNDVNDDIDDNNSSISNLNSNSNSNSNSTSNLNLVSNQNKNDDPKVLMSFSTSLLPVVRLLFCWFKEREIARVYLKSTNVSYLLAKLINLLVKYLSNDEVKEIIKTLFPDASFEDIITTKPIRQRLYKEDVALREFKPVNFLLSDFNDLHLYKKDPESVLALIGELSDSNTTLNDNINESLKSKTLGTTTKVNDNLLRLIAIIILGKFLVLENTDEIKWIDCTIEEDSSVFGYFDIPKDFSLEIKPASTKASSEDSLSNSNKNSLNKETPSRDSLSRQSSKDQSKESTKTKVQQLKKKSNSFNSEQIDDNPSNKTVYAGSSFSSFGLQPSESFGKFSKYKKNKQLLNNRNIKSQSSSDIDVKFSNKNISSSTLNNNNRPHTSQGIPSKFDDESHSHSQYTDMVNSIIDDKGITNKDIDRKSNNKNKKRNINNNESSNNNNNNSNNNYNNNNNNNNNKGNKSKHDGSLDDDKSSNYKIGNNGITNNYFNTVPNNQNLEHSNDVSASSYKNKSERFSKNNKNNTNIKIDKKQNSNDTEGKEVETIDIGNNTKNNEDIVSKSVTPTIDSTDSLNIESMSNSANFGYSQMNAFTPFNEFNNFNNTNSNSNNDMLNGMNNITNMNMNLNKLNFSDLSNTNFDLNSMNNMNLNMNNFNMNMNMMNELNNMGNINNMNNLNSINNNMNNMNNMYNMNGMTNMTNINNMSNMNNMTNLNNLSNMNNNMNMNMNMNGMNSLNNMYNMNNMNSMNNINNLNKLNGMDMNLNNINMNHFSDINNNNNNNNNNSTINDMNRFGNMNLMNMKGFGEMNSNINSNINKNDNNGRGGIGGLNMNNFNQRSVFSGNGDIMNNQSSDNNNNNNNN